MVCVPLALEQRPNIVTQAKFCSNVVLLQYILFSHGTFLRAKCCNDLTNSSHDLYNLDVNKGRIAENPVSIKIKLYTMTF